MYQARVRGQLYGASGSVRVRVKAILRGIILIAIVMVTEIAIVIVIVIATVMVWLHPGL